MNDSETIRAMSLELDALILAKENLSKRLEKELIEMASITDFLNIYLREKGAAEVKRPEMREIKLGIDRLVLKMNDREVEIAQLKEGNQLLRRKIENHIIMSEDFKAEYNDWLGSLGEDVEL